MRKEILFAVIAGVLFGAVLAFGIWRANIALKPEKTEVKESDISDNNQVVDSVDELKLTLAKPENYDVITESPMIIAGVTKPKSWIVISAEDNDYIFQPEESGEFSQEVKLSGGVNQIIISAYDTSGNSTSQNVLVVYSTEFSK